jgi:hypothetical protein
MYVRVEDTGRGIPPERLDAIFEPYQQAEVSDQDRGTGLGVSISRQLARVMGGDLTADGTLGVGSRFTLWLPITPSDPVPRWRSGSRCVDSLFRAAAHAAPRFVPEQRLVPHTVHDCQSSPSPV